MSRHTAPFNAFFLQGSDSEITVSPQTGELLPEGSQGTQIKVTFAPAMYGKTYKARLVVQVSMTSYFFSLDILSLDTLLLQINSMSVHMLTHRPSGRQAAFFQ